MMDFSVIERHPWYTTAIVGLGGLGLYLILRRGSSGSSGAASDGTSGVQYVGGGQPSDAAIAANAQVTQSQIAANAQTTQLSAQLAALGIQSDMTVRVAEIGAGVQNYQTAAALQSDLTKTGAALTLGLSSQQAQVDIARINAGVQQSYINKMTTGTIATQDTQYRTTVPSPDTIHTQPAPITTQVQTPPGVSNPYINIGDAIVYNAGNDAPLVPKPNYAVCAPTDSACVARNQQTDADYWSNVVQSQANNNYNRCIADGNSAATCAANKAAFHL